MARGVLLLQALLIVPFATALTWGTDLESIIHRWLHGTSGEGHSSELRAAPHPRGGQPAPEPPSWVAGAGVLNRTVPIDYANQMMHRPEVDLVASYLRPDDVYLEYGSGGSTRNFPRLVRHAFSIEHDCEWSRYLRAELDKSHFDYSNLNLICVPVEPGHRDWGTISTFEHGNYKQFKEYVDKAETLPVSHFDRVFIDGRARKYAARFCIFGTFASYLW